MKLLSWPSGKRHFRLLVVCITLLLTSLASNAQCWAYINIYESSPSYALCNPQQVTLTAEMYNDMPGPGGSASGVINWYTQETGGQPFYWQEISTNQDHFTSSADVFANDGVTIWVSYYDRWTGCESPRVPYTFYLTPTPSLNGEYSYLCGNVARIKMSSTTPGVTYYLYKEIPGSGYSNIASSTTGYFEITDYDPNSMYTVLANAGGCSSSMYQLWFDDYSADPPTVTGNLSIYTGASTKLNAYSANAANNFKWYDGTGNFLYDGDSYSTPPLTTNTNYQVRWYSEDIGGTTCVSNPRYVTVQVTTPPQPVVCDLDIYVYQSSGPSTLCTPQTVTLTADFWPYMHNGSAWGALNWYTQETGGQPFQSKEIATNQFHVALSADVMANDGVTIWVSYLDHYTGCESPRIPYTFYITPTPNLYWEYSYACGNVAKVKVGSTTPGVWFFLYKKSDVEGNPYEYRLISSTGYFEITDYKPDATYYITASVGECSAPFYQMSFDEFPSGPPPVTGNTTIPAGSSTTLTASGDVSGFNWYDGNGNLLHVGTSFTTPVLSENVYTYQVRAATNGDICLSEPSIVTVTVNLPDATYSSLYNSSNFSKSIDFSKPVGTVNGTAGTSTTGAATYNIPIYAPAGTNGMAPSVNIGYSSQSGNGIVGYGWNIAGLSAIGRSGKDMYHDGAVAPVTYTGQDAFTLNGTRLNSISGANGANGTIYAVEAEGFSKIISNGNSAANPDWFQVIAKDGSIMEFGHTTDSRMLTDDGNNVMMWRLNKVIDITGNYVEFKYDNGYRDSRIDEINYTGNANTGLLPYNKIKFNYEVRNDVATLYVAGASLNTKHILKSISITNEGNAVKTYQFNYGYDNLCSLLKEVIETGNDGTSLNSTIFLYGDQPQNMEVQSTDALTGYFDFFAGDFNADGKTDLLAASIYSVDFVKYHSDFQLRSDITAGSSTMLYMKTLPSGNSVSMNEKKFSNFLSSDYDGDGRDDVMQIVTGEENQGNWIARTLKDIKINYTRSFNSSTGWTDHVETDNWISSGLTDYYKISRKGGKYFVSGDFDGDGNQDYILILGRQKFASDPDFDDDFLFKGFFYSPSTGVVKQQIANFGVGANLVPSYYTNTIANADVVMPIDFDGDGKQELFVVAGYDCYVLSLQKDGTGGLTGSVLYSSFEVQKDDFIYPGDFNGDSKTDLLIGNKTYQSWKILYSTGKTFTSPFFKFTQTPNITGTADDDDRIAVADFNGDGKTDILHAIRTSFSTTRFVLYYSKGNADNVFLVEQYDYNKKLAATNNNYFVVGDFNGDGRSDLLNSYSIYDSVDLISFKPFGKERLLAKVTDGHNVTQSFEYKLLTDKEDYPYMYNRTISLDDPSNKNPFNYVQLPAYAVSAFTSPDGIGGLSTTTFNYEDAVLHRVAKGFLGFKKIIAKNASKGIISISENEINTDFGIAYPVKQTTHLIANGTILSTADFTTSFNSLSTGVLDPKRFIQHNDKVLAVDHLTGTATETSNTYDNYGNITARVVKTGALSGAVVNAVETVTNITTFGTYNTPVPARPDKTTVVSVRNGMPSQSITTTYTYNSNGTLASQTKFSGLPKALTNTYTYNSFGNITQVATTSPGLNIRILNTTYDNKGRFVLTKQTGSASLLRSESFTYDGKCGQVLSHTSTDCLNTTYVYDGYGRLTKTTLPEGYSITTSLTWDVNAQNVFYQYTNIPGGSPGKKVWFDILGRETTTQIAGFNNQWLTQKTTYDIKGNVASKTNAYYSTETPLTTVNTYDAFNRLQTVTNALNTINYTYTSPGGGKLQVTTQDISGQSASKISDATGKVITAIDNGGQVDFTYNSAGQQVQVIHGNVTLLAKEYDSYGRAKTITDKSTGTITYEYDAFGQMKQQTDNNGNTYNMTYDDFGRIITRQGPEGITSYEYYMGNGTGCSNDNLAKVTNFNGVVKEYTYDNMKRLQTEKQTIDGTAYITQYGYNSYGNLTSITYPSGVVIKNNYDNNGQLVSVTGGDATAQTTLFTGTQMNGAGEFTGYTLGNNRAGQNTYNYGIPIRFYTAAIQDLNLNYDYAKGVLLDRRDAIKNITETFQYDNLNRLTQTSVNSQVQLNMAYDNNAGHSWGNIISKTDAGNYVYKNDKIHAVAYITNPTGDQNPPVTISATDQAVTYTPFLKTASIAEGAYQELFTYGADCERVKTTLQQNGSTIETRYFLGGYEKQVSGTSTREIHYVGGGNGLCAIIVRENGVNNFYFVYTDHLGSLLTFTDINGNVVAEQNFDAWGRNRNPSTWQYRSVPAAPVWLYRGFTGHEHLPQFALINMNGRIYDPIQGRMLSPDNYVASPFNTQGYNRYAYANNNPLMYVDQDGNFAFVPILIAAAIGAGTSAAIYSVNAASTNNWTWGGFFKAAAMGAVSGAIGGTIAQVGISWGVSAQNLGLSVISNVGSQVGTNLAFGHNITFGMMAGATLGGLISNDFGNFTGVEGGQLANMGAEIGFNAMKYGFSGAIGGTVGAFIDGQDAGAGLMNGLEYGALGGATISALNIVTMGPTYVPDTRYIADMGKFNPVYRSGTFLTHWLSPGGGITLGRNIVTNFLKGNTLYNHYLIAHESEHYMQEMQLGFGKMYQRTLSEYHKYGFKGSYSVSTTLEYQADGFSGLTQGYYYDVNGTQVKMPTLVNLASSAINAW